MTNMMPKYVKAWMAGISLLLLVLMVNQYSTPTLTQEVDIDALVKRVAKMLKPHLSTLMIPNRFVLPSENGLLPPEAKAPPENRPKPHLEVHWKDAIGYFRRQWSKTADLKCNKVETAGNWEICQDPPFEVKPPCLVYSFGIFVDWSFDEHMGLKGCEVHSFDPSLGKEDHIHSPGNVSFHDLGIGPKDTDYHEPELDKYVKTKTYWKVRTVKSIMKMLGHEGRKLDVLKMDVETDEWETLINMVDSGLLPDIKQFLIEWHLYTKYPSKDRYSEYYHAYEAMRDAGFQSYHKLFHHTSYSDSKIELQADVNYLNTRYQH